MTNRKSHTLFRLVPKSTTLDDHEWLIRTVAEKMRLSEPTTKIWMTLDPYCHWQKCWPLTSFCWYKIYVNIRRGSPGRGHQMSVGLSRTAIFSIFASYFFRYFRDEASIIIWWYAIHCRLFSDTKCMTLNDPDWLIRIKFCFHTSVAGWDHATSERK